jgi:hypothetical protein
MKFSKGNSYLGRGVWAFNLVSGTTCPYADTCLARTDRETGKLIKGENMQFKCYSAAGERYPAVRNLVWNNYEELLEAEYTSQMVRLLLDAFPKNAKAIRIHAGGDFFSQAYFDAWLIVAKEKPDVEFWAFTKSLPLWIKRLNDIPENLELIASYGGTKDHLIEKHSLKSALVVGSHGVAKLYNLEVDDGDRLARLKNGKSFALIDNFAPKQ